MRRSILLALALVAASCAPSEPAPSTPNPSSTVVKTAPKDAVTAKESAKPGDEIPALINAIHSGDATALKTAYGHLSEPNGPPAAFKKMLGATFTPLTYAAIQNLPKAMETLLDAGADPNFAGEDGLTPLMVACRRKAPECIRLLLKHNADASRKGAHGETAMSLALQSKDEETIKALKEAKK